ncbi:N-terminal 7TM region of histidine kinase [Lachnospiraceae bacterium KH1T2]|nr:N-terminal 7TM region of histidine kinase [Lachnospiraceae bacterium KH1T2]
MVSNYFAVLLIISIFIVIYIALKNYENIDIYYWTIVILAPLILLSYWLMTRVRTREGAMIALCFEYLDSTVMLMVVLFAILNFMRVTVNKWIKGFAYTVAFAHMFLVWCCIDNALYYKSIRMINTGLGMTVRIENGPLKVIHWGYLTVMMIVLLGVIALAWLRRGTYSRRTLTVYTILVLTGLSLYIVETVLSVSFSLLPTLYVIADIFVALNYDRDHIYDIPNLVSKQYDKMNSRGYVAVDTEGLYLGSNMKSYDFFPELELQIVDTKLKAGMSADIFYGLIEEFRENHTDHKIFNIGDMVCRCEAMSFTLECDFLI